MHKILFAASEAHPLVKTGGLGDVAGSLPAALKHLHQDVRLILPAYRVAMANAGELREAARLTLPGYDAPVRLWEGRLPGTRVPLYLVDYPTYFDRPGGPYAGPDGRDWPDNAARYALFARAAVTVAMNQAGLDWQPDIVHCNDWQTGLIPALLAQPVSSPVATSVHRRSAAAPPRPATLFTIHNLAYQGLFPWEIFQTLGLPHTLWSMDAMEFYGKFSFIKGGLVFADRLTTVSPTYAREIRTPALGCGLDGLLNHRAAQLTGILNGADYNLWDPRHDPFIAHNYNTRTLQYKALNKTELQRRFNLPQNNELPLLGHVGRLVEQKGIDLLLDALPHLMQHPLQIAVLGSGERRFEQALLQSMERYPGRIGIIIGYHEELAHLVEAGADMFVMPSRFEPCGLNQLYSLRYGTAPIAHRTGGLADTIVDATPENLKAARATGFLFDAPTPAALHDAALRALTLFSRPPQWRKLMRRAMAQDFSWHQSARQYLALYQQALADARTSQHSRA
ncbi:MAG: glycogen synthase GlgA [Pseudomonadota bacterium]